MLFFFGTLFLFGQFGLQFGQTAVFEFGRPVEVVAFLRFFDLVIQAFQLFAQFLHFANGSLFVFPLGFQFIKLAAHFGEFLADFFQMLLGQLIALFLQGRFFDFMLNDFALDHIQFRRHGVNFRTDHGAGFIHQVDGLIGQEPVGDVPVRQGGRRNQGRVLNFHAVEHFIPLFQPTQNGNGVFDRGFLHQYRLEPAFQGRVFFDVFAVFVQGGSANAVQFAPRQHGL